MFNQHLLNEEISLTTPRSPPTSVVLFCPYASLDPSSDPLFSIICICPLSHPLTSWGKSQRSQENQSYKLTNSQLSPFLAVWLSGGSSCLFRSQYFSSLKETVCKQRQRDLINYLINSLAEAEGSLCRAGDTEERGSSSYSRQATEAVSRCPPCGK